MSTDARFAAAAFPELRDGTGTGLETRERVRGHAAGYAAGFREAHRTAEAQRTCQEAEHQALLHGHEIRLRQQLEVLNTAAEALSRRAVPVAEDVQDAFVEAAFELAEAIVGHELRDAGSAARSAVTRALAAAGSADVHRIRLHPADLEILAEEVRAGAGVVLAVDPALRRGDAVAELADGFVDARIGTSLARAKAALQGPER